MIFKYQLHLQYSAALTKETAEILPTKCVLNWDRDHLMSRKDIFITLKICNNPNGIECLYRKKIWLKQYFELILA